MKKIELKLSIIFYVQNSLFLCVFDIIRPQDSMENNK